MTFDAPWGLSLKLMSLFSAGILLGVAAVGLLNSPGHDVVWFLGMVVMPLAILIGTAFFTIRGYELNRDTLLIRRLAWETKVDLIGLQAVEINPEAMKQ